MNININYVNIQYNSKYKYCVNIYYVNIYLCTLHCVYNAIYTMSISYFSILLQYKTRFKVEKKLDDYSFVKFMNELISFTYGTNVTYSICLFRLIKKYIYQLY